MRGPHQFGNCTCCGRCTHAYEDWEIGEIGPDWEIVSGEPEVVQIGSGTGSYYLRFPDENSLMLWHPEVVEAEPAPEEEENGGGDKEEEEPIAMRVYTMLFLDGARLYFNYVDQDNHYYVAFDWPDTLTGSQVGHLRIAKREAGVETNIVTRGWYGLIWGQLQITIGNVYGDFNGIVIGEHHPSGLYGGFQSTFLAAEVPFINTQIGIGTGDYIAAGVALPYLTHSPPEVLFDDLHVEYYYGSTTGETCLPIDPYCNMFGILTHPRESPAAHKFVGDWYWAPDTGAWLPATPDCFVLLNYIQDSLSTKARLQLVADERWDVVFGWQDAANYYYIRRFDNVESYHGRHAYRAYQVDGGTETLLAESEFKGDPLLRSLLLCMQGSRIYYSGSLILHVCPAGMIGLKNRVSDVPFFGYSGSVSVTWEPTFDSHVFEDPKYPGGINQCGCPEPCPVFRGGTTPRWLQIDEVYTNLRTNTVTPHSYLLPFSASGVWRTPTPTADERLEIWTEYQVYIHQGDIWIERIHWNDNRPPAEREAGALISRLGAVALGSDGEAFEYSTSWTHDDVVFPGGFARYQIDLTITAIP